MMKKIQILIVYVVLGFLVILGAKNFLHAETLKKYVIDKPHTFSPGTPARSSEVNENFDVAYEHIQKLINVVCKYHPTETLCQTSDRQETWTNDFGMTFVLIQPGTFVMGSPEGESGKRHDEVQHSVTLTQSYYLQTTEVTQGQWKAIMGSNPSHFSSCGDNCPVDSVTWEAALEFIEKLNLYENANRYKLPTEAQWEYAARAGSTTALANGNLVEIGCGLDTNLDAIGWYCGNSDSKTHPVAQKQANAWGLFDMHGNIWEWCSDWYGAYPDTSVTDPEGPSSGSGRVGRGGSYGFYAQHSRSADRYGHGNNNDNVGLRLLRTP